LAIKIAHLQIYF